MQSLGNGNAQPGNPENAALTWLRNSMLIKLSWEGGLQDCDFCPWDSTSQNINYVTVIYYVINIIIISD